MSPLLSTLRGRRALALLCFAGVACNGDSGTTPTPTPPTLTTVNVALPSTTIVVGQTVTATAAGLDQNGAAIDLGTVTWSASPATTATVAQSGVVTAVAAGTAQIGAAAGGKSGAQTLTVVAPAAIAVNEVESNGGTPGDWIELYNPTAAPVDISGWVIKDNDDSHAFTIPASTTIAAGGYYVAEEAALGYGLGGADAARLFNQYGAPVDSYDWTAHAAMTYGRCPDGSGAFAATSSSTKGAANDCAPSGSVAVAWPGTGEVHTIDGDAVFGENLSGLDYEDAVSGSPAVIWAVLNGPGTLYRLIWNGTIWNPDAADGWTAGKALHYGNGLGNADSEGVTYADGGSAGGLYVSTERNNDASTVSHNAVLRFDPSAAGTSLSATNEWDLTSDLPATGANLGIEAITWVPDTFLVARHFYDEAAGHAYVPSEHADHGTGLFFVGLEANGMVYAYALDHATNGYQRIATIATGFPGVMDLQFDGELGYLWAICDDGCGGKSATLEIDATAGSATVGHFLMTHQFGRPATMPNINNEGFAIAPQAGCVSGFKSVFWSDDGGTDGHSMRSATLPCARF